MTTQILTQADLKAQLNYDPLTGIFTRLIANSPRVKVGDVAGCKNVHGYLVISVNGRLYSIHRLAWLYTHGEWPKNSLDHINCIRDDNSLNNLREATNAENCQNKIKPSADSSSGLLGVSWNKAEGKWRARIKVNYKETHIGYFTDKFEARSAYLAKKIELHPFGMIEI